MKKVKTLLKKCKQDGTDPLIAILELRATPLSIGYSPTEILMGRKIRTFIPMSEKNLTPKTTDFKRIRSLLEKQKCIQKKNYDKHSRPLKPFNIGENVRIQQGISWNPAVIQEKLDNRSYSVETPDGGQYIRNRQHLMKDYTCQDNDPPLNTDNDQFTQAICSNQDTADSQGKLSHQLTSQHASVKSDNLTFNHSKSPASTNTLKLPNIYPEAYVTRSGRQVKPKIIQSV